MNKMAEWIKKLSDDIDIQVSCANVVIKEKYDAAVKQIEER